MEVQLKLKKTNEIEKELHNIEQAVQGIRKSILALNRLGVITEVANEKSSEEETQI